MPPEDEHRAGYEGGGTLRKQNPEKPSANRPIEKIAPKEINPDSAIRPETRINKSFASPPDLAPSALFFQLFPGRPAPSPGPTCQALTWHQAIG
jgi:hypothetical protein